MQILSNASGNLGNGWKSNLSKTANIPKSMEISQMGNPEYCGLICNISTHNGKNNITYMVLIVIVLLH